MSALRGKTLAIDGHCFLHRACFFAPEQILLKDDVSRVVKYMTTLVDNIQERTKAMVFMVMDGGCLPLKSQTDQERTEKREQNLKMYHKLVDEDPRGAREYLMKAFTFTPAQIQRIAKQLIENIPKKFSLILSPYEADAQLAFLHKIGLADVIVTTDADLLLYDPDAVLFGYDPKTFEGRLVERSDVFAEMFENHDLETLRKTAILSGCDYVDSMYGVGLKGALKALLTSGNDINAAIDYLHSTGKQLPCASLAEYKRLVAASLTCFKYHVIYNPLTDKLETFSFLDPETEALVDSIMGFKFYGDVTRDITTVWAKDEALHARVVLPPGKTKAPEVFRQVADLPAYQIKQLIAQ